MAVQEDLIRASLAGAGKQRPEQQQHRADKHRAGEGEGEGEGENDGEGGVEVMGGASSTARITQHVLVKLLDRHLMVDRGESDPIAVTVGFELPAVLDPPVDLDPHLVLGHENVLPQAIDSLVGKPLLDPVARLRGLGENLDDQRQRLATCEIRIGDTPIARANCACDTPNSSSVSRRNSPGWIGGKPFLTITTSISFSLFTFYSQFLWLLLGRGPDKIPS